ncbi:MAG: hypothetical protein JWR26_93 [Pedosphaera sp.]|nr:hypothetical protein [Pedosphaera sp.]
MKKPIFVSLTLAAVFLNAAQAQKVSIPPAPKPVEAPVPIYQGTPPVTTAVVTTTTTTTAAPPAQHLVYFYEQKPLQQQPTLIAADQAQSIVDQFRTNYSRMGNPRVLIYVNRELVDATSGLKLASRSEKVETTRTESAAGSTNAADGKPTTTTQTVANNQYSGNGQATPTLADRQTVRDVERLIGRPLRAAGVTLVDQPVAAQLIGNRTVDSITADAEQARKNREAVNAIADVVVEVLISSRNITVSEASGDKNYSVPDIQMTAIRLKDAKMIGQATASDVMNRAGGPAFAARNFGVQDITEGTALALMQDILQEAK